MRKGLRNLILSFIFFIFIILHFALYVSVNTISIVQSALASHKKTLNLILKSDKTPEDIEYIKKFLTIARTQSLGLAVFFRQFASITPLLPTIELVETAASVSPLLPKLLGEGLESNMVVLFLNNYELRPGGGFIGSIGFVTFKDYSLTKFEVQDVYEIDGQLTTHFEPHFAVRKYLNQPNEFLRDSNFSPDFSVNAKKAVQYLSNIPEYNKPYIMVAGLTTSAFEQLLQLSGPIELTDFDTTITAGNFFSVTQRAIENDFFPGSRQKRSILQSLGNQMLQRFGYFKPRDLFSYFNYVIKTKNLVLYSANPKLQNLFLNLKVSGVQSPTYGNWIMPVDSNVGVNKMDALIRKAMVLRVSDSEKVLIHTFNSTYTNTITADAAEKESYKNYFQLYVPKNAVLKNAQLNGSNIKEQILESDENQNKIFAFYFETPPASSSKISITYTLPFNSEVRQLHFQKQTGSKSSPLTLIHKGKAVKIRQQLIDSDEVFSLF